MVEGETPLDPVPYRPLPQGIDHLCRRAMRRASRATAQTRSRATVLTSRVLPSVPSSHPAGLATDREASGARGDALLCGRSAGGRGVCYDLCRSARHPPPLAPVYVPRAGCARAPARRSVPLFAGALCRMLAPDLLSALATLQGVRARHPVPLIARRLWVVHAQMRATTYGSSCSTSTARPKSPGRSEATRRTIPQISPRKPHCF